jgi:hypothetical protein
MTSIWPQKALHKKHAHTKQTAKKSAAMLSATNHNTIKPLLAKHSITLPPSNNNVKKQQRKNHAWQ